MSRTLLGMDPLEFILSVTVLVIAVAVMLDVFTQPAVAVVRRVKDEHLHVPSWAPHNTHKHRRGH